MEQTDFGQKSNNIGVTNLFEPRPYCKCQVLAGRTVNGYANR